MNQNRYTFERRDDTATATIVASSASAAREALGLDSNEWALVRSRPVKAVYRAGSDSFADAFR